MLTPRYLEGAPDAMVDLYSEVEADILTDMARRIARYDFFIPAAEHQLRVLEEMGAEQAYILRRLAELTGRSEEELRQLFEASGGKALVSDQADYRRAGLQPPALNTSQELQQVLSAGLRQTQGLFTNLTRTTALDSGERFRAVLDRAWLQVSTGGFDANTAIRNAIKELTRQGLTTVDYASGRTLSVEAAVRMNVVNQMNAATQQSLSPSAYGGVSGRSASIPALATGAVIPPNGEFLAVLGDQKKGRNLEAPENLIRQIVREESGGGLSGTLTIRSAPGLTRYLAYELKREDARAGTPLVEGTRR